MKTPQPTGRNLPSPCKRGGWGGMKRRGRGLGRGLAGGRRRLPTDVGPSLPVQRQRATPLLRSSLLLFKEDGGENTRSFDLYESKYKLCAKII